jgi:hypothetical protein
MWTDEDAGMSEILCKQRGVQLEHSALILRNVHTLQIQMTMLYPRECRDTFPGLNADAAWSSRRVNGRTSKGSLDVGSAHPRAPCDSGHPCNFHCPTDVLHSSEVSYVLHQMLSDRRLAGGLRARRLE